MNTPPAPSPTLGPVDLSESVAGEEDPGASMDLPPVTPASAADLCPLCGGSGKIASGACPDCKGSGKRTGGARAA